MTAVIDAISAHGPIAWAKWGGTQAPDVPGPPHVVWRFAVETPDAAERVASAVESFCGHVAWVMYHGGRNYVIMPAALRQYLESGRFRLAPEGISQFAAENPHLTSLANEDCEGLARRIRESLEVGRTGSTDGEGADAG